MRKTPILAFLLCHWIYLGSFQSPLDRVPVGAVFDRNSIQVDTAFSHEVQKKNSGSGHQRFELKNWTITLDVTDSFAVSNALCSHLSMGVFAIFGVSNASSLATIQSYTNTFKVPFLTFSMAQNTSSNNSFQIYMRPLFVNAIIDVIAHYEWKRIYYIYDTDEGLIRLQQLFQSVNMHEYVLDINAKRVSSVENCYMVLKDLHLMANELNQHLVLDMEIGKTQDVILKVKTDPDINNVKFHFLIAELGMLEMNLTHFNIGGMNITGFEIIDPNNSTVKTFLDQWANMDSKQWPGAGQKSIKYEAALAVDAVNLFIRAIGKIRGTDPNFLHNKRYQHSSNKGIKCTDNSVIDTDHGSRVLQELKKTQFNGITGRVAFDDHGHRKDFSLEVYDVAMNRGAAKVGHWNEKDRLVLQQARLWRNRNRSSRDQNRTQIVTTIQVDPYVKFKTIPVNGLPLVAKENLEGFCMDLAQAVAENVGFDYDVRFVKDNSYGAIMKNGTWNGMVGELSRHEADLAIAPLTITAARERIIDFTKPFMSLGISIMIKKPENQKAHVFSFMDPLSYEIWMCIVFAYIGVSVVLFLVSRFSPNEWHMCDDSSITNDFTISNSLWFSLGAFMQQGCDISPRSMSGRIVGSVWWFFTLIIISSYTANLAAFLTVERMLTPVESAEDLAKQTDIHYGTVSSGSTKMFFKNSKVAIYHRMWSYMTSAQPSVFVNSIKDGIEKVRNEKGKYAFLIESTTNDFYNQRKPCDTMKVGQNLNSNGFGIATPVGSELKDYLNFAVLELRESGKLAQWQKHWWYDQGECARESTSTDGTQSALTLQNVAGIFYILIGGLILALVTAVVEFFYKSRVDSRKYKTTFGSTVRSKARLSFRGHSDSDEPTSPPRKTLNTYTYTGPTPIVGVDTYQDGNTHTQV
ncbi:glutamate receptor-like isoform X1 [Haliotis cracherodii]|uniref:glutamate receptor-like isoform X1 n=1 Tax=Haliotis rufescens TaxID=6454 RepID=UPI001EAFD945|nr:glutamate receptor-like isoform X1 [Haliotis rufescens]